MTEYCLLFGTLGGTLTLVTERLRKLPSVAVEDVEASIISEAHTEDSELRQCLERVQSKRSLPVRLTMGHVIGFLPRDKVCQKWQEHCHKALKSLLDPSRPGSLKVLSGHVIYYSPRRSELYCPIDMKTLSHDGASVRALAMLIDDVYDRYFRLRKPGWLFHNENLRKALLEQIEAAGLGVDQQTEQTGDPLRRLSDEHNRNMVLTWKANCLQQLLSWRSHELLQAEFLARELGNKPFLPFPAKQPLCSLKSWLDDKNPVSPVSVYIAHSITKARMEHAEALTEDPTEDGWPPVVDEVAQLPGILARERIHGIMPTGIDEMRFEREAKTPYFTGRLRHRWPIQGLPDSLMYECPAESDGGLDHLDLLFSPERFDSSTMTLNAQKSGCPVFNSMLRGCSAMVAASIAGQVSSRDHFYVAYCRGLLAYRPLYGGAAEFSGGVAAELKHWREIATVGASKPAAIVHFDADIHGMVRRCQEDITGDIVHILRKYLVDNFGYSENQAKNYVKKRRCPSGGPLETTILTPNEQEVYRAFTEKKLEAKQSILFRRLSHVVELNDENLNSVFRVWVVRDYEELRETYSRDICDFLTNHTVQDNWRDRAQGFLPDDFLGIY